MIENLKKFYKDALITANTPEQMDKFIWFISEKGSFFGIDIKVITSQEIKLLSSLFTRFDSQQAEMTDIQASWYNFLYLNVDSLLSSNHSFTQSQFILFQASRPISDRSEFQVALEALMPCEIILLWENDMNGVVIAVNSGELIEDVGYDEIIATLTSDFYVDIHLFIGRYHPINHLLPNEFSWEKKCFEKALLYLHKQKVSRLHDVIPFMILENIDHSLKDRVKNVILQELQDDHELVETIKVFLESDLNVSNASKKLYMHRNSLQYRIDKFIEKTGIDIKHFQGAVTTYLAILSLEHFSDS
ncbi:PucR family transcriptional regulator [Ferdinandcohnia quinoae]|nr:helix-turn-helix domain-containing protein [Fredinandcohnia sp. SECRCQ15]